MKTLVIGGTGFIGRRLVANLIDENVEVTIATRGKTPNVFGGRVKTKTVNRFDEKTLKSLISEDEYYDLVFDQVGYGPDDMAASISALSGSMGHYIYTSSVAVYKDAGTGIREEDFDPLHYRMKEGGINNLGYSEGKRSAEAYLFRHSKVPAAAARFPIVLGPDDVTGRVQFHIERILTNRGIVIPEPCGKMNFVSVEDAGRFLAWLGLNLKEGQYNAASPEAIDASELVHMMAGALDKHARIIPKTPGEEISPYRTENSRTISVEKAMSQGFKFTSIYDAIPGVARKTAETQGKQLNTMDYLQEKFAKDNKKQN